MCNMSKITKYIKYSEKALSNVNKSAIIQLQKQKRKVTKIQKIKIIFCEENTKDKEV